MFIPLVGSRASIQPLSEQARNGSRVVPQCCPCPVSRAHVEKQEAKMVVKAPRDLLCTHGQIWAWWRSCHRLSQVMSVQTDKSLSTQGSTTSPKGKCCPTTLRPWEDFPTLRQCAFDEVYNTLHPPNNKSPRLLSPLLHIEELGRTIRVARAAGTGGLLWARREFAAFVTRGWAMRRCCVA